MSSDRAIARHKKDIAEDVTAVAHLEDDNRSHHRQITEINLRIGSLTSKRADHEHALDRNRKAIAGLEKSLAKSREAISKLQQ